MHILKIHKSGYWINIRNYRSISKLSVIPKLFEAIITKNNNPNGKLHKAYPTLLSTKAFHTDKLFNLSNICLLQSSDKNCQVDTIYR